MEKAHKQPHRAAATTTAKSAGEVIASDIQGPMSEKTASNKRYSLLYVDEFSRYTWSYLLEAKGEQPEKLKNLLTLLETQHGLQVKTLRSDGGKEYVNQDTTRLLESKGIRHQVTARETSASNGIVERKNRTVIEATRAMMTTAGLPRTFWGEALTAAVYVQNRLPTKALGNMSPVEKLTGERPSLKHLRVWGCACYVYIPRTQRAKLDSPGVKCIFVGYQEGTKGYRCYNAETGRVIVSRDVTFDETDFPGKEQEGEEENVSVEETQSEDEEEEKSPGTSQVPQTSDKWKGKEKAPEKSDMYTESAQRVKKALDDIFKPKKLGPIESSSRVTRSSGKELEFPEGLGARTRQKKEDQDKAHFAGQWEEDDAQGANYEKDMPSLEEALYGPNANEHDQWMKAIDEEMTSLQRLGTFTAVNIADVPAGRRILKNKWVLKRKSNHTGSIERYKARLVACGYSQVKGLDYNDVFAPVVKWETVLLILTMAVNRDWEMTQFDVDNAYLHATLSEQIYMQMPKLYEEEGRCFLLRKSLYGLKQAGMEWYKEVHTFMAEIGFTRSDKDWALFYKREDKDIIIVLIYVDDIFCTGSNPNLNAEVMKRFARRYKIKDLGRPTWFLGVMLNRLKDGSLELSQRAYINKMLTQFEMGDCHPVGVPASTSVTLSKEQAPQTAAEQEEMRGKPYRNAVGALMYLAGHTRPDVTYIVHRLAQFCENPGVEHWQALQRVFKYLQGTKDLVLRINKMPEDQELELEGFVGADWAGNENRRSTSGYAFFFCGSLIAWSSTKQRSTALSTGESEYMSLSDGARIASARPYRAIPLPIGIQDAGGQQRGDGPDKED